MNKRHRATLDAIREKPTRSDIEWRRIDGLLVALGATVSEGAGARARYVLNGTRLHVHRPHGKKEAGYALVRDVERFLEEAGVI